MQRFDRQQFEHFDFLLFGATVLLALIGIAMIYSATACITDEPLDFSSPTIRQLLYLGAGIVAVLVLALIDFRVYNSLRWIIWLFVIATLATVLVIGQITRGAQRWIDFGFFLFQPSEVSKLLVVIVVAKYMADHADKMSRWRYLAISLFFVAIPLVMIYAQPDLGTTLVLAATWGVMAIAAGLRGRDLALIGGIFIFVAPLLWLNLRPYQQERVLTFLDPGRDPLGAGYNVLQARIAIGSGGLWGQGFCSGTQSQLRFLRIRQTDFIFSVIGEELGFIGALFVLALIAFILFRLVRAAMLARSPFGKLIAVGVTAGIFAQSVINLAMNMGLVPVTGIPLPYVSYGGSSLISLFAAQGVVQSILLRHRGLELDGASREYE
ncbi:MAG: rod shape-determining protein RodA [Chloroflexi bacterium]|nr:rod shape-determining protein RodA [Chloroflexota bacterium]